MSQPFLAEVRIFGFNFNPRGWAKCDGQLLPINQNQSLYSLLGTTYGGNGRTDFQLPDLRGRAAAHKGATFTLGQRGGQERHQLTIPEIPAHTHQLEAYSGGANSNSPNGKRYAQASISIYHALAAANQVNMAGGVVANAGSNSSHDNMQPYQVINFCIAIQGLFPSRN